MQWEKFERIKSGRTRVVGPDSGHRCEYQVGSIVTGKQRVFHLICLKLTLPDGEVIEGKDRHSIRDALFLLNDQIASRGMTLVAAGIDPEFYESGLSFNTGYGYLPHHDRAIYMMDAPPPRESVADEFVEGLIRNAVRGMFIRQ